MEKASDVYNKLKLRFVGKAEVAAKPQTENKEPEDDEKETQETGKKPHFSSFFPYQAWFVLPCMPILI